MCIIIIDDVVSFLHSVDTLKSEYFLLKAQSDSHSNVRYISRMSIRQRNCKSLSLFIE